MRSMTICAVLAAAAVVATAQASVSFSFADPVPGRQLHNVSNGAGAGVGALSYDTSAILTFLVDGSEEGFGAVTFTDAHMELSMSLGAATTLGTVTVAPVSGSFTIYRMIGGEVRQNILTGTASAGSFVRISNTNSMLFSDPDFVYSAGAALTAIMPEGMTFASPSEAVFTLTDVAVSGAGPASFIGPGGVFRNFDANASFTGNTATIPAPGASVALALSGLAAARRRRA